MKRKIKLFGRKKLILSLYDQLDEKERKIKNLNESNESLSKDNDDLKNKIIISKGSQNIANEYNLNNFMNVEILNNKSFLDAYKKIFTNLDLLSTKEYKNFVEILLFDKSNIYPQVLKNSIMKEYIRQCLSYYKQDYYIMPIYFNEEEYNILNKNENSLLSVDSFNANHTIKENHKNKTFIDNLNFFNSNYNREINFINSINDITADQILFFKEEILSLVSELILFLIFDYNESIDQYYITISKFLKDFDYKGFDKWQTTTNNPLSIKTFMKTLIKLQWLSLNKKNNSSNCNFYLEYPNNYNLFLANFGKQNNTKNDYITKLNIISKGTSDNFALHKSNEYYSWLLTPNKENQWFDNLFLTEQEILSIINNPNTSVIKIYGLKYNLTNSLDNDIIEIVKNESVNIKLLKLDNQYLIERLFFYFIYINRHK